jgi:hypothetical protein
MLVEYDLYYTSAQNEACDVQKSARWSKIIQMHP